jgi:molybdopterin converting factor subunit 1
MHVRVKLFAQLRDVTGRGDITVEIESDTATVDAVWQTLVVAHPELQKFGTSVSSAVNDEYAKRHTIVRAGDEVAFLPPVSGG